MHRDVEALVKRIDTLTRAAGRLRTHAPDLHALGWDAAVVEVENVASGKPESKPPRAGNPRARWLFENLVVQVERMEAELVGFERTMMAVFFAGSSNPEPSRGSMISRAEFDRLRAKQRARSDGHPVLVDQPQHPGRKP